MAENLNIALEHLKNNFIDVSIREFQGIIKKEPENSLAHLYLSRALEKKANQERSRAFFVLALEEAKKALKTSAGLNKEIHQQLINMYHKCDQLDVAIVQYKKLGLDNPGNEFFAECLKQISTLSSFNINAAPQLGERKKDDTLGMLFIVLVIGALVLIVLFGALRYFQMNTPLK
ncbi:MAG: tetratricopeptide repeat protein [bacterium]|nr:tetratricopeptide repeat protein [bacterium]